MTRSARFLRENAADKEKVRAPRFWRFSRGGQGTDSTAIRPVSAREEIRLGGRALTRGEESDRRLACGRWTGPRQTLAATGIAKFISHFNEECEYSTPSLV